MNGNSKNSKDFSAHTAGQPPLSRWRAVFITMLVLVLVAQSASYTFPAQAQGDWQYLVDILNFPPETLCIGQSTHYRVHIVPKGSIGVRNQTGPVSMELLEGTTIKGQAADPSIADFTGASSISTNTPDAGAIGPRIVDFTVKAKRMGRTTITFRADVIEFGSKFAAHPYTVDVNVQKCSFKVSIMSHWEIPDLAYMASIDEADLIPDATGNNYTGIATVTWSGWWDVIPPGFSAGVTCTTTLTSLPSQAYLTGKMDDNGFLEVNVTYRSNPAAWRAVCRSGSGSTPPSITPETLTADSLQINFHANSVAQTTQHQALLDQIDAADGLAHIRIFPDTNGLLP